jgi:hypothetical protein
MMEACFDSGSMKLTLRGLAAGAAPNNQQNVTQAGAAEVVVEKEDTLKISEHK